ncbi:X-ray radiation resistance-associated protein 1 [Rhinophrynus dorsalis]
MAAAGPYKMDCGDLFMSNCFPARSLFRTHNRGAGHWLMTHKTNPGRTYSGTMASASAEHNGPRSQQPLVTSYVFSGRSSRKRENVLDALFLMKTHYVKRPADLCSVDVSDRNLTTAKEEEFAEFNCVAYINASENMLTLESFRTFPALRELDLSMNGISRVHLEPTDFPQLEVLDLSYNGLSPDDVSRLGVLPHLRVLHLTGNGLTHLPLDMSAPQSKDSGITMFPALEVLMLDDNKLTNPAVFASMASLKSLRLLNLDKNAISEIPYLHEMDTSECSPPSDGAEEKGEESETMGERIPKTQEVVKETHQEDASEPLDYMVLPSAEDPDRTEVIFTSINRSPKDASSLKPLNGNKNSSFLPSFTVPTRSTIDGSSQMFSPPLPSLKYLSLANNKILHEENLLAVALFPSLEELVIHGNPLTNRMKRIPPLLKSFLQQRLGINVRRKKSCGISKPHIYIPVKEKRKVTTHIPKIPKQPLMLEPPSHPFLGLPSDRSDLPENEMVYGLSPSPLPPIFPSSEEQSNASLDTGLESDESSETLPVGDLDSSADTVGESVFMTQVDDLPDPVHVSRSISMVELEKEKEQEENEQEDLTQNEIPEKFRGYEELFSVRTDPDFIEPLGIQNNVKALEYALKHLLVYRDPKPRLSCPQKPYVPRKSKFGKELVPLPRKDRKQMAEEILLSMRAPRNITHVPLDSILQRKTPSKEKKEAQLLLKELRDKYRALHAESVNRAAELEDNLLETAKRLRETQRTQTSAGNSGVSGNGPEDH